MSSRLLSAAFSFVSLSVLATDNLGVAGGYGRIDVSSDKRLEETALAGRVYTYGLGTLTLVNPLAATATMVVDAGGLQIQTTGTGPADVAVDGVTLGRVATGELQVAGEDVLKVDRLWLGNVLTKSGTGELRLGTNVSGAGVALQGGTLGTEASLREDLPVVVGSGVDVEVAAREGGGAISASASESASVVEKRGAGMLTMSGVGEGVETVRVQVGGLRVQAPIRAVFRGGDVVTVANASFESGTKPSTYNTSVPADWSREVKLEGQKGTAGHAVAGSPWIPVADGAFVPDGNVVAFVQDDARLSQSVQLPKRGRYRVSMWLANRYENANTHTLEISLGGEVLTNVVSRHVTPLMIVAESGVLEAGSAVLSLTGKHNPAAKNTPSTVIDDIRISLVEEVSSGTAVDQTAEDLLGGREFEDAYEAITAAKQQWLSVSPGNQQTIGGWTFTSRIEKDNCGPNINKITPTADKGKVNALIQNKASVSRKLELPTRGVYRVSLRAAGRQGYQGHHFRVTWKGQPVGTVWTTTTRYRTHEFQILAVQDHDAGILSFDGEGGDQPTYSSLLDDVQVVRLPQFQLLETPALHPQVALELAAGTCLDLDFQGQLPIAAFSFAGRRYSGVIDAQRLPGVVSGAGSLSVKPLGLIIMFR